MATNHKMCVIALVNCKAACVIHREDVIKELEHRLTSMIYYHDGGFEPPKQHKDGISF